MDRFLQHSSQGPAFGLVAVCAGWKRALDEHYEQTNVLDHESWMAVQAFVEKAQKYSEGYIDELDRG